MHDLLEEFEEVGDEQIADMQAVHVGVGGEDDLAVAQVFDSAIPSGAAGEIPL